MTRRGPGSANPDDPSLARWWHREPPCGHDDCLSDEAVHGWDRCHVLAALLRLFPAADDLLAEAA